MNLSLLHRLVLDVPWRSAGFLGRTDAGEILHRHRLSPLLWSRLERYGSTGLLRPEVATRLRQAGRATLARNLIYLDLLDEVTAALDRAGIPSVPLKGLALLRDGVYRPGERPVSDLDLLVGPEMRREAAETLYTLGFSVSRQPHPDDHCLGLAREGCNIGLHHEILPSRRYWGFSPARAGRIMLEAGGRAGGGESSSALLFSLVAHYVYSHGATGAVQLADLLLLGPQLAAGCCPDTFRELCAETGMTRGVMAFLQILDASRPGIMKRLLDPAARPGIRRMDRWWIRRSMASGLKDPENGWHWIMPLILSPGPGAACWAVRQYRSRQRVRGTG